MTINERFKLLINSLNFSEKDAMERFGFSLPYLRKLKTKDQSFGVEPIIVILKSIPGLNARWLIMGEGQMMNDSFNQEVVDRYLDNITKLISLNADLMEKINLKDREKELLLSQIMELKDKNIKLATDLDDSVCENKKLTDIIKDLSSKLGEYCPSENADDRARAAG